jgi:hypothetical protein
VADVFVILIVVNVIVFLVALHDVYPSYVPMRVKLIYKYNPVLFVPRNDLIPKLIKSRPFLFVLLATIIIVLIFIRTVITRCVTVR